MHGTVLQHAQGPAATLHDILISATLSADGYPLGAAAALHYDCCWDCWNVISSLAQVALPYLNALACRSPDRKPYLSGAFNLANTEAEARDAADAVLRGRVASVVYRSAIAAVPADISFRRKFLDALAPFRFPGAAAGSRQCAGVLSKGFNAQRYGKQGGVACAGGHEYAWSMYNLA